MPDPAFPGHQGAVLAIWKSAVEWGSIAHGNGSGDPTQPILGSGGANFDFSFQGEATGVGGTNSNIHSALSGSSGGLLGYAETPVDDGWRIRYYDGIAWSDGPGANPIGQFDLQAMATFFHGIALGLGTSSVLNATMYPISSGSTDERSIEADDMAGTQAIYGAMSATKPTITSVFVTGNQMTISGTNFNPSGNRVWFTQGTAGGTGQPVEVGPVASNGTSITVTVPAAAGPGDVLVRGNGSSHMDLSNAWPTTTLPPSYPCSAPQSYCTSLPNSAGPGAQISSLNMPSLSANNFQLLASGLPANKPGIFFYGTVATSASFGEGLLCTAGSIQRLPVQMTDSFGDASRLLDFNSPPFNSGSGAAVLGATRFFQFLVPGSGVRTRWVQYNERADGWVLRLGGGIRALRARKLNERGVVASTARPFPLCLRPEHPVECAPFAPPSSVP